MHVRRVVLDDLHATGGQLRRREDGPDYRRGHRDRCGDSRRRCDRMVVIVAAIAATPVDVDVATVVDVDVTGAVVDVGSVADRVSGVDPISSIDPFASVSPIPRIDLGRS